MMYKINKWINIVCDNAIEILDIRWDIKYLMKDYKILNNDSRTITTVEEFLKILFVKSPLSKEERLKRFGSKSQDRVSETERRKTNYIHIYNKNLQYNIKFLVKITQTIFSNFDFPPWNWKIVFLKPSSVLRINTNLILEEE